jgi:hypothetical protein
MHVYRNRRYEDEIVMLIWHKKGEQRLISFCDWLTNGPLPKDTFSDGTVTGHGTCIHTCIHTYIHTGVHTGIHTGVHTYIQENIQEHIQE